MSQHDMIIDNSTGANVRADINNALGAIATNNSGSSAPSTTYALQTFANTTSSMLQLRNAANNAFVNLRKFDGSLPLPDGSASSPSLFFDDDTNTGIFSQAADKFNISAGGNNMVIVANNEIILNEEGLDCNFRVEGDNEANLLFVDAGNDRIGIGTNSPATTLQVDGKITVSSTLPEIFLTDTNASNARARINANGGGLLLGADNDNAAATSVITFEVDGSEHMRVQENGRLFLGTTSNTFTGAGNARVQVSGSGADTSGINLIRTGSSGGGAFFMFTKNRGSATQSGDNCGSIAWFGHDGTDVESYLALIKVEAGATATSNTMRGDIVFETADGGSVTSERMRLDSSGALGLGLQPADSFSFGQAMDIGSTTGGFYYARDTDGGADAVGGIGYSGSLVYISNEKSDGVISFRTNTSANERARIDSTGRFLVGTTSARAAFSFTSSAGIQSEGTFNKGSISSTNNESNGNTCAFVSAKIRGSSAVSNNDLAGSHDFEAYDGTAFRSIARMDAVCIDGDGSGIRNNVISGDIKFSTRINDQSVDEIVRFTHYRIALFGTSALPSASAEGCSIDCDPADLPVFWKSSSRQHGSNAYTHSQFFNTNGAVCGIMVNGSGTSFQTSSDYRLKENETAITDGITRLKQLKPYKFNFKADSSTILDGFFAHEVASVVPDAVSGEKDYVATEANVKSGLAENVGDIIPQQIDHSKLVPLLVAAVKDLIAKVETLEAA